MASLHLVCDRLEKSNDAAIAIIKKAAYSMVEPHKAKKWLWKHAPMHVEMKEK